MNSTLREIEDLVRAHLPALRAKQRFVFSKVTFENGKFVKEEMGTVVNRKTTDK
jgi:hypothetical protein